MIKLELKCPICGEVLNDVEEGAPPNNDYLFTYLHFRGYCNKCDRHFDVEQQALIVKEKFSVVEER